MHSRRTRHSSPFLRSRARVASSLAIVGLLGALAFAGALGACGEMIVPAEVDCGAPITPTSTTPIADAGADADAEPDDAVAQDGSTTQPLNCKEAGPIPPDLRCTGLYSEWTTGRKTIASDVKEYKPGLENWMDTASQKRWISLPAGQKIDTSDPNEWRFPIGTKIWQQVTLNFSGTDIIVETRYMTKVAEGIWFRTTFEWERDQSAAASNPAGRTGVVGTPYEIPEQGACGACHFGRKDFVLGVEAVSLAHASATGLTLSQLVAQGLVTDPLSPGDFAIPGNDVEKNALGYLHVNCGVSCHNKNPSALAYPRTGAVPADKQFLRLEKAAADAGAPTLGSGADVKATGAYVTAVNRPLQVYDVPPDFQLGRGCRIRAGSPELSAVYHRVQIRDRMQQGQEQMPSFGSNIRDLVGEKTLADWISAMPKLDPSKTCAP